MIEFDGINLRDQYNFIVRNIEGREAPPVSDTVVNLPLNHGAILKARKFGPRKVSLTGYVYDSTASKAKEKLRSLIRLISQAYGNDKPLTFLDTGRTIYVRLDQTPVSAHPLGPTFASYGYQVSLNFIAYDPFFYGEPHTESGTGTLHLTVYAPTPLAESDTYLEFYAMQGTSGTVRIQVFDGRQYADWLTFTLQMSSGERVVSGYIERSGSKVPVLALHGTELSPGSWRIQLPADVKATMVGRRRYLEG